ncbi:ankyrin repeat and LEM domain-containing protein 1 [Bufo gargarizans]|uniref:ankyrin repeat and LEM domain-containing protein 1 n=1 Tax=Bufo gargarizans TaxID=30331 RepID=UPI001CF235EC|nr:ankyrin repeat and LEM domain-containing protein 1 [Bufo gargarizans]
MEDLAGRLCEAVENEDAKEVEDLLQCGADPNLVLPNGIAAIHLASGKESECALRCLTLILQHGGNPNVRSTDDLTPVHVAASWGCCKALLFLLRKGGDPSIQDQDGNTALDLALMENNRRCVVALQEFKERIPGGCADSHKNYSTAPDDITEMSCISLLLEPTYENSPLSSTKISPMLIFPKTLNPLSHMDDAVISSQAEMPYLHTKNESRKRELGCSFKSISDECELNPAEAKEAVPGRSLSQSGHCTEYFSTQVGSDLTLDNSSISKKTHTLVDYNWENTRNTVSHSVSLDIDSAVQQHFKSHREVDMVCEKLEALDVTSPDHVYTYNKEHSKENMEKTLILVSNVSECKILAAKETCCRSNYSDCNTSLWDSGHRRWGSNGMDSIYDSGDATVLSNRYDCKTMNAHSSGLVAKEDLQAVENERLTGASTQIVNSQCNRTHTVECTNKTIRTSEVQFTSQSSTVPIENTSEHDGQDLQIHLRDLLLSTKACHKTGSQAVCANTIIPVSGETRSPNQKDASYSSSSTISEGNCFVEYHEGRVNETGDSDLQQDLKKMMLATKNSLSPAIANEDKSPFFTPRSKSRLRTFKVHQNSSSLFDDSMEMPKRGRRVRSPGGLASPTHNLPPDEFLPRTSSYSPSVTYDPIKQADTCDHAKDSPELTLTKKIPQYHGENLSEAEATISITNFLTDDLSSETEEKSCLPLKQANSNHGGDGGFSDSAWLTEDGESEISGVAAHKKRNVCSTTEEKSLPASLSNRSFFHSTLLEDTVVNSCKPPRYSFSRISLIPRVDGSTVSCLRTLYDSASQEMPLSPGGRPVNVSQVEPVEYVYKDNEKGHVLIEKHMPSIDHFKTDAAETSENTIVYDWRNYKINTITINKASSVSSPNRVAVELYRLSNDDIASRLRGFGEDPGQVTSQNRKTCILLLDKCLKEQTSNRPMGLSIKYSPELSLALHTFNISDCSKDEAEISREFDQPDKTRKWREGVLKSSFNYLLLDPRVTRNLPSRCRDISPHDCFRTFVSSVFYVGKGKRSRPYCHLYEALTYYKGSCKKPCSKVQHIVDIWKSGQGVLSLHCFQNTIPVEAYTREACMVDAIGLKMLTNQKRGIYYGQAQNWSSTRQQRLGVHILFKAMQIFLAEGERQLRPPDIRSGQ